MVEHAEARGEEGDLSFGEGARAGLGELAFFEAGKAGELGGRGGRREGTYMAASTKGPMSSWEVISQWSCGRNGLLELLA